MEAVVQGTAQGLCSTGGRGGEKVSGPSGINVSYSLKGVWFVPGVKRTTLFSQPSVNQSVGQSVGQSGSEVHLQVL